MTSRLAAWMSSSRTVSIQPMGRSGLNAPLAWPRLSSGRTRRKHGLVQRVHVLGAEARVDLNERVVAPQRLPAGAEHAGQRVGGFAVAGVRGAERVGGLGDRAVGDGRDQRLAGGEVDVDGGAHDARAASDLGHAGVGIARERVDGGVQDRGHAAVGVGTSTPGAGGGLVWSGRHRWASGWLPAGRAPVWAGSSLRWEGSPAPRCLRRRRLLRLRGTRC